MYAKRNTITIALLWAIIIVAGFLWYSKQKKEITTVKSKYKKLNQQLDGSLEVAQALEKVQTKYKVLKANWEQSPKKIINADEPSFSLYYLNWLIQQYDIELDFDFMLNNINEDGEITTFRFTLTGEGTYYNIYRIIMYLTENPILYQIQSYHLKQLGEKPGYLTFNLQIVGFSINGEPEHKQNFDPDSFEPVVVSNKFYDSFKALRRQPKPTSNMFSKKETKSKSKPKPKPVDDGLIDVEKASLQAVANRQVYLKDKSGKLVKLKLGDKVHLGSLTRIDAPKSEIEFKLTGDGKTRTVVLGLGYKK